MLQEELHTHARLVIHFNQHFILEVGVPPEGQFYTAVFFGEAEFLHLDRGQEWGESERQRRREKETEI